MGDSQLNKITLLQGLVERNEQQVIKLKGIISDLKTQVKVEQNKNEEMNQQNVSLRQQLATQITSSRQLKNDLFQSTERERELQQKVQDLEAKLKDSAKEAIKRRSSFKDDGIENEKNQNRSEKLQIERDNSKLKKQLMEKMHQSDPLQQFHYSSQIQTQKQIELKYNKIQQKMDREAYFSPTSQFSLKNKEENPKMRLFENQQDQLDDNKQREMLINKKSSSILSSELIQDQPKTKLQQVAVADDPIKQKNNFKYQNINQYNNNGEFQNQYCKQNLSSSTAASSSCSSTISSIQATQNLIFKVEKEQSLPIDKASKSLDDYEGSLFSPSVCRTPELSSQLQISPFSHFFLIGCDTDTLRKADVSEEKIFLDSKLLYSFGDKPSQLEDPFEAVKKQVVDCAFPEGVECRHVIIKEGSDAQIEATLLQPPNKRGIAERFSCFKMRSQEELKQVREDRNKSELLSLLNPQKNLYFTFFILRDFLETTDVEQQSPKSRTFWRTSKMFCFMSFLPLYELHTRFLTCLNDSLKVERQFLLSSGKPLNHLGTQFLQDFFTQKNAQSLLNRWKSLEVSHLNQQIIYPLEQDNSYILHLPEASKLRQKILSWALQTSIPSLSLSNFIFIFFSLLQEQHLVFVSQNLSLLTKTIATFEAAIMPFQWPYPIVYALPDHLYGLLESPQPIIVGMNKSGKYLLNNDDGVILTDNDEYKNGIGELKNSLSLRNSLSYHYSGINPDVITKEKVLTLDQYTKEYSRKSKSIIDKHNTSLLSNQSYESCNNNSNNNRHSHSLSKQSSQTHSKTQISHQQVEQILEICQNQLRARIISLIPKQALFTQFPDYAAIQKNIEDACQPEDKNFISTFCSQNSQIFLSFCEDFYNTLHPSLIGTENSQRRYI